MRYTNRFKTKVIAAIQGGLSQTDAEKKFKVTSTTIRSWLNSGDKTQAATPRVTKRVVQRADTGLKRENMILRNLLVETLLRQEAH